MRLDWDTYREITASLKRNRRRTLLTGFGVFWGIFMLLFLMGGGNGLKTLLAANFEGFATNTTILVTERTTMPYMGLSKGRYWNLTYKDVERLKIMMPELEVVTPTIASYSSDIQYQESATQGTVKGVYADYVKVETPKLKYGRYINESDVIQERKVCVIGERIYNSLFPDGGDPCGSHIKVGSVYYQVVGVDVSAGNVSINGSADQSVIIPISIARKIFRRGEDVDIICVTAGSGISLSEHESKLRGIIAREHKFNPEDKQALVILYTEEMFSVVDNLFKGVNFLIMLIGLGTILAGVIGVSNIMMVTVKERTTEIGIRRAIGATPKDILFQIIMEGIILTAVSGMAGIVFSVFILNALDILIPDTEFQISFWTAVLSALLLTVMGVLAGLAPAYRAMEIKPVDAMRDE
jgi:putative ABC transport system permease protein